MALMWAACTSRQSGTHLRPPLAPVPLRRGDWGWASPSGALLLWMMPLSLPWSSRAQIWPLYFHLELPKHPRLHVVHPPPLQPLPPTDCPWLGQYVTPQATWVAKLHTLALSSPSLAIVSPRPSTSPSIPSLSCFCPLPKPPDLCVSVLAAS